MTVFELLESNLGLLLGTTFVFSLLIGSFLNVVILRLPARLEWQWRKQCQEFTKQDIPNSKEPPDLVFARSHCPQCGYQLKVHENIPLFSFVYLRGRCASCACAIPLQYPLVELITGLVSTFVVFQFGTSLMSAAALVLTWGLIALTVIDLRTQLLPDSITLPLMWIGLLLNTSELFVTIDDAVIGAAAGYLSLWLIYQAFKQLTGKEGMGYGDFKLMAVFGAWLGWQLLPLILLLSSLVAALVGIGMIVVQGRDKNLPMAFGPYIAAAGWMAVLWGEPIMDLYLGVASH